MKQYDGAVFFVDMLGIGFLTQDQIKLEKTDFIAWGLEREKKPTANLFGGRLLSEFRRCLNLTKSKHTSVRIAQLSDCAYIWGDNIADIAEAARTFMWDSVTSGLLCRGGLAYGEIVEPDSVSQKLGQFVLGRAVTNAVKFERAGKGCRIFTNEEVGFQLTKDAKGPYSRNAIAQLKNPLDGTIVDEFRWYATGGVNADWKETPREAASEILRLLSLLKFSPRFRWNEANSAGRVQLACSIESISESTPDFIGNGNYRFESDFYLAYPWNSETLPLRSSLQQTNILDKWLLDIQRYNFRG